MRFTACVIWLFSIFFKKVPGNLANCAFEGPVGLDKYVNETHLRNLQQKRQVNQLLQK